VDKPVQQKKPLPKSQFERQKMSEDTEREMQGRPQKYGAAMEDDPEPEPGPEPAQPGQPTAPPDAMGQEPQRPGMEEGGPPDPEQAQSREEAEQQVAQMPNTPETHHALATSHHGHLHDIHKRLRALEGKGGAGEQPPAGSGPQPAGGGGGFDDDGY
jgi:hypothetical protein